MSLREHGFIGAEIQTWIKGCHERHSILFEIVNDVNRLCQGVLFELAPHNKHLQEMLVAALYGRVLSNYQAVVVLCERGMMAEARVVTRAMLEGVFSLCAIASKPPLATEFVREHQRKRLRFLNKFRALHGGLPAHIDAREVKRIEEELKDEIKTDSIQERSTEEWAKDAGMHKWYLTAYTVLSDSVHVKARDLECYLVRDEEGIAKGLQWGPDDSEIRELLTAAIEGILVALRSALSCFRHSKDHVIDELLARLRKAVESTAQRG